MIPRSRFKRQWVFFQFSDGGEWMKGFVRKMCQEGGSDAYEVAWENGDIETVFVCSVFRILAVNPKRGRVVDFAKRRQKRIRLV